MFFLCGSHLLSLIVKQGFVMFQNAQELSQSASNYKEATLHKVLSKKRSRACTKRGKTATLDSRILRDQLIVSYMNKELRREMKQFEKTVHEVSGRGVHDIPLPDSIVILRENVKLAENNLVSARCAKAGMDKYPPLK